MVESEDCTGRCKFYNSQQYNAVSEFSADAGGDGYVHCVVDIACDTCGWTGSTDYSWDFPLPEPKVWECQQCNRDIDLAMTDEDEPKFCSNECKWYDAGYICEYCKEAYHPLDEETVGNYCSQSCKEYKEEEGDDLMKYREEEKEYIKQKKKENARLPIVCADGFTMSVQANAYTYCTPRDNDCRWYAAVEVGFPSEREELLMPWVEAYGGEEPTTSVYPYTPARIIMDVIVKHGGMVSGELPPLKMIQEEEE